MKRFRQLDFTQRVGDRELGRFLLPLFLSAGFQCIYAMVNTAVLSRYLSQDAVALTGACSGCVSLINTMLPAFVSGFGVRACRSVGRRHLFRSVYFPIHRTAQCLRNGGHCDRWAKCGPRQLRYDSRLCSQTVSTVSACFCADRGLVPWVCPCSDPGAGGGWRISRGRSGRHLSDADHRCVLSLSHRAGHSAICAAIHGRLPRHAAFRLYRNDDQHCHGFADPPTGLSGCLPGAFTEQDRSGSCCRSPLPAFHASQAAKYF